MMMNGQHTHALNGIRTHGLSVQAMNAYASFLAVTGTGEKVLQIMSQVLEFFYLT
jgi:hypothetical protein